MRDTRVLWNGLHGWLLSEDREHGTAIITLAMYPGRRTVALYDLQPSASPDTGESTDE